MNSTTEGQSVERGRFDASPSQPGHPRSGDANRASAIEPAQPSNPLQFKIRLTPISGKPLDRTAYFYIDSGGCGAVGGQEGFYSPFESLSFHGFTYYKTRWDNRQV